MSPSSKSVTGNKTHSYVQFITTPTADTPGTGLLLHFDDRKYVIGNTHEGIQRAGLQTGARFFRAKDFFLTGKTEWNNNGGLLGLLLSLADSAKSSADSKSANVKEKLERKKAREEAEQRSGKQGKKGRQESSANSQESQIVEEDPTVTLHGGPNLTHTIATARSFIFRHGTPIKVIENHEENTGEGRDWNPTWEDARIQVWAMAISPSKPDGESRPTSPRKRSLGDYITGQGPTLDKLGDQWSIQPNVPADQEKRNQEIREFVVSEMFSSSWRYDNLEEKPLREVVMPAGIFTRDPKTKRLMRYVGPIPDGTTPVPDIKVLVRSPWPGALVDHLPPTKPSPIAMSYIIRNHKQRGKFKPEAAKALNVKPGPLWSALAKGSEVQSSDGKTITPDMVLEPAKEGGGLAVVELPSRDYIDDLIRRPEWKVDKIVAGIGGIVWILGPGVSQDERLCDFMKSRPQLRHVMSSSDYCPNYLVQTSAATAAIRHNQIDPIRFPVPVHSNILDSPSKGPINESTENATESGLDIVPARRGLKIELEPSFRITEGDVIQYLNTALVAQETPKEVLNLGRTAQQKTQSRSAKEETENQDLPGKDAEIICLGTGSASPSPYRNVAGTLLRVPGHGSYLLDCGENSLGQLKRIFSEAEFAEVLQDLKLIWISHLHADHHLGTTSVIKAWYEEVHGKDPSKRSRPTLTEQLLDPAKHLEGGNRLFIVAHGHMLRWLEEYSSVEDFGYNQLVPVRAYPSHWSRPDECQLEWNGLNVGFSSNDRKLGAAIRKGTSLSNLVTVPVSHCHGAQAISLTFPDGFKFSYSGDCRPSKQFALAGKDSTVLLHEATFDDELSGDAEAKKHSTTSEAIGVGMAMGAKRVLLTHFSQRYQKIPSISSMNNVHVKLEDTEEAEDPMEGIEPPVNAEDEPPVESLPPPRTSPNESGQDQPQTRLIDGSHPPGTQSTTPASVFRPPATDMKVAVAFDYMRVKVGDIIHLENFHPALRELYKDAEREERDGKAKRAAKEAFSDETKGNGSSEAKRPAPAKSFKESLESPSKSRRKQGQTERNWLYWEIKKARRGGEPSRTLAGGGKKAASPPQISIEKQQPNPDLEKLLARPQAE